MELISQPWPWYVAGPLIAFIMISLILSGNKFGLSSNLRSMCAIMGAGKHCEFFNFDWKSQIWNLVFVLGLIGGGIISDQFLNNGESIQLSEVIVAELNQMGIDTAGNSLAPEQLFSWNNLLTIKGLFAVVIGGFLVGFGARYAGGCTSGHAISGLSDLQLPSLIAVIGFFVGGLAVTYFFWPHILNL